MNKKGFWVGYWYYLFGRNFIKENFNRDSIYLYLTLIGVSIISMLLMDINESILMILFSGIILVIYNSNRYIKKLLRKVIIK